MDFTTDKPIYRQIADRMDEYILRGEWTEEERIPAVRELAVMIGVNPNTVMRAYESLQSSGVIYNRRGIGYFVSPGARGRILETKRDLFLRYDLPEIFEQMEMLGIPPRELAENYEKFLNRK